MNLYAITDNPSILIGLEMANISTQIAQTPAEFLQALTHIPKSANLVIITESLSAKTPEVIQEYRARNPKTLLTIIPDTSIS